MDHGTVTRELVEYQDGDQRIVVCELRDGWHVVEVYRNNRIDHRHVTETLNDARAYARKALDPFDC